MPFSHSAEGVGVGWGGWGGGGGGVGREGVLVMYQSACGRHASVHTAW